MRIVMKFGGSSVSDSAKMLAAAQKAVELKQRGNRIAVVVSAQGKTTDCLAEKVRGLPENSRELDVLLAAGEQISAALMAMTIGSLGVQAQSLLGWQMGLRTDGCFGNARVEGLDRKTVEAIWDAGKIAVAAGFQGVDENGSITTLGRGGSDTTAVALAAFLHAEQCLIYTDVDGIYDLDPRKYPQAKKYDQIGYDAALALSLGGAKVLHSRCIELGKQYGVPIRVLSSFRPGPGTLVCGG